MSSGCKLLGLPPNCKEMKESLREMVVLKPEEAAYIVATWVKSYPNLKLWIEERNSKLQTLSHRGRFMISEFYINFKAKKAHGKLALSGAPKTSIKKPTTRPDEVCVKMKIEIPDSLFDKPILVISGKLGQSSITKEHQIQITQEAKELIEGSLGIICDIKEP